MVYYVTYFTQYGLDAGSFSGTKEQALEWAADHLIGKWEVAAVEGPFA